MELRLWMVIGTVVTFATVGRMMGWGKGDVSHRKEVPQIRFNSEGRLRILQLSDFHYGESDEKDRNTSKLIEDLVKEVKPDLVTVTGDLVSGYAWDGKDFDFYQKHWREYSGIFEKLGVPYAIALGNHDSEANLNRKEIMAMDATNRFSLFPGDQGSDPEAGSDYIVRVGSSSDPKRAGALLWMLDTLRQGCGPVSTSWGCLKPSQIEWFDQSLLDEIETAGRMLKGLAFFHIPPPEFVEAFKNFPSSGHKNETVGCPKHNNNMLSHLQIFSHTLAVFCGHDHNNDYAASFGDIDLVYGRKTGFGSYGPLGLRGGRVIELQELPNGELSYKTWIVDELMQITPDSPRTIQHDKFNQTRCDF